MEEENIPEWDPIIFFINFFDPRILNLPVQNDTIHAFFQNHILLFHLVRSIFNFRNSNLTAQLIPTNIIKYDNIPLIRSIPDIFNDPELFQNISYRNIWCAIHELHSFIPEISSDQPFETMQEQIKFFELIILNGICDTNPETFYNKFKPKFDEYEIPINNLDELLTPKNILALLKILFYEKPPPSYYNPLIYLNNGYDYFANTINDVYDDQRYHYSNDMCYICDNSINPSQFYDLMSENGLTVEQFFRIIDSCFGLPVFVLIESFLDDRYKFLLMAQICIVDSFINSGYDHVTYRNAMPQKYRAGPHCEEPPRPLYFSQRPYNPEFQPFRYEFCQPYPNDDGQGPGYDDEQGPGYYDGQGPGYDDGQGPGYDDGQGPGYGNFQGPGYDNFQGPGYDNFQGPGYNNFQRLGYDSDQGLGYDSDQGFGYDSDQGPIYGQWPNAYHHQTNPRMINQQQDPRMINQYQDPRMINQQQNPRMINQYQNPRMINQQQDPRMINQYQDPRMINQQQDPRMINQQQDPRMINQQQDPRMINQYQDPRMINQQQDPRMINQYQDPRMINQQQDPRMINQQQDPRMINQYQDPRMINQQQDPRMINQQQNPNASKQQQKTSKSKKEKNRSIVSTNSTLKKTHSSKLFKRKVDSNSKLKKVKSASAVPDKNAAKEEQEFNEEQKKARMNELIAFQQKNEEALLETINALSKKIELHFNNFYETVVNDAIPKFVISILKIESIEGVDLASSQRHKERKLTPHEFGNIETVISFLRTKETRFTTISFDFKNEKLIESSAILFYTTFLNSFFLKRTRKQIFNQCLPIISYKTKNKKIIDNEVLLKSKTYDIMVIFINLVNCHFNKEKVISYKEKNELFTKAKVPKLFDQSFLNYCLTQNEMPDVLYYQLQFIINEISTNYQKYKIILILINWLAKFKKFTCPSFDTLAKILKGKKNSKDLLKNRSVVDQKPKSRIDPNSRFKKPVNELYSTSFKERLKSYYTLPIRENYDDDKHDDLDSESSQIKPMNFDCSNFCFFEEMSFNKVMNNERTEIIEKEWMNEIQTIQNKPRMIIEDAEQKKTSDSKSKSKSKSKDKEKEKEEEEEASSTKLYCDQSFYNEHSQKAYKIFKYSDHNKIWKFNDDVFHKFCKDKSLNTDSLKTPVVLFLNSIEEESKSIISKLISRPYPDDKEDSQTIYVYAFCDRDLSMMNYQIDSNSNESSNIKPIFLLLHVPQSREKDKEINKIVAQIYSFLQYISDFKVVILNQKYYTDQIEISSGMTKLYSKKDVQKNLSNKSSLINKSDKTKDDDDIVVIIDEDEEEEQLAEKEEKEQSKNDIKKFNDFANKPIDVSQKVLSTKSKFIFLINDTNVRNYDDQFENDIKQSLFFNNSFSRLSNNNNQYDFHFINTNEPATYKPFLATLIKNCSLSEMTIDDVKKSFKFVKMSQINLFYFTFKIQDNWREQLSKMVIQRCHDYDQSKSPLFIATQISNDLVTNKILTPFDLELNQECFYILSQIADNYKRNLLVDELGISSYNVFLKYFYNENKKDYLYQFIDKKLVKQIKGKHEVFLNEEYLDILNYLYSPDEIVTVYERNMDILNEEIKRDFTFFDLKKNDFIEKKRVEIHLKNMASANYEIRQKEKVKEIKVQIEAEEDLRNEIEQDF